MPLFVVNDTENRMEVGTPNNCVVLCDKCADFCPHGAISFPDKDEFKNVLKRLREESSGAGE